MLEKIKNTLFSSGLLLSKMIYKNRKSKILYYHDVHNDDENPVTSMSTPMSLFRDHIQLIKEQGFEIVDVITQPENQIMLTFDDGFIGIYINKFFFIEQGLKPTIFIITDSIGKKDFLTTDNIVELHKNGFRFQSHTHSHPDLNLLSKQQLVEEFTLSKIILEKILSEQIDEICFPKGFFNNQVIEIAHQCGYVNLFSSLPGFYGEKNKFNLVLRNLVQFTTLKDLKSIIYGGSRIYRNRYLKQHYHQ